MAVIRTYSQDDFTYTPPNPNPFEYYVPTIEGYWAGGEVTVPGKTTTSFLSIKTKSGERMMVPVQEDGTVRVDLEAFLELLAKAGVTDGDA
jgi:hypothetical protein